MEPEPRGSVKARRYKKTWRFFYAQTDHRHDRPRLSFLDRFSPLGRFCSGHDGARRHRHQGRHHVKGQDGQEEIEEIGQDEQDEERRHQAISTGNATEIERYDDSKKSHPALARAYLRRPTWPARETRPQPAAVSTTDPHLHQGTP